MASNENEKPAPVPSIEGEPVAPVAAVPLRWVRVSHHTPDHIASRYLYAGYGSNLCLEQLVRRCSGAEIVGPGILRNARLVFAYHLGIVEDDAATTLMGVFKLTAADVAALDRYEALGRSYERFLVTVEVNGAAVRCFTYVKRNNEPEQPSARYYNVCLQGFADWNFDSRRLRHAREFAKKNEKPKRYGRYYSTDSQMDWHDYMETGRNAAAGRYQKLITPHVPTVDGSSGTAAGKGPRVSLVTGRNLSGRDNVSGRPVSQKSEAGDGGPPTGGNGKATGKANAQYKAGDEFQNPRTGEVWIMGKNRVWLRKPDAPDAVNGGL